MTPKETDKQTSNSEREVNRGLSAITKALIGSDEERRRLALATLPPTHPGVGRLLAERLVTEMQRGEMESRQRALAALVVLGKLAVPTVALMAVQSRKAESQLAAVEVLRGIGEQLSEPDRVTIKVTLIDLLRENREKVVRDEALSALLVLRCTGGGG
jgi:hypothetical protein